MLFPAQQCQSYVMDLTVYKKIKCAPKSFFLYIESLFLFFCCYHECLDVFTLLSNYNSEASIKKENNT